MLETAREVLIISAINGNLALFIGAENSDSRVLFVIMLDVVLRMPAFIELVFVFVMSSLWFTY